MASMEERSKAGEGTYCVCGVEGCVAVWALHRRDVGATSRATARTRRVRAGMGTPMGWGGRQGRATGCDWQGKGRLCKSKCTRGRGCEFHRFYRRTERDSGFVAGDCCALWRC